MQIQLGLQKKNGEYKIIWTTNLICPGLNNEDEIKINTTEGKRGSIYDRNGNVLAKNGEVSSVGLIPGKMRKNTDEDIERIAKVLGLTVDGIKGMLNASYVKDDTFVFLSNISQNNLEAEKELLQIAGIKIRNKSARIYPYNEVTSHLVGYVQNITKEEIEENLGKGYNTSSVIRKNWNREGV